MGLFGFGGKKGDIVDLSEKFRKQKEREAQGSSGDKNADSSSGSFSIFDSGEKTEAEEIDLSLPAEKRRKFAKRILDLTTKIEDLSNQIYHLQQRVEVLEKKSGVRAAGE